MATWLRGPSDIGVMHASAYTYILDPERRQRYGMSSYLPEFREGKRNKTKVHTCSCISKVFHCKIGGTLYPLDPTLDLCMQNVI